MSNIKAGDHIKALVDYCGIKRGDALMVEQARSDGAVLVAGHPDGERLLLAREYEKVGREQPATTIEQLLAKANRHAALAAWHERKAAEHEAKRLDAVESARQLMPGYTIEISAKWERDLPEEQPEDMTDPANWKAGDVVEWAIADCDGLARGNRYTLHRVALYDACVMDDDGDERLLSPSEFRWISRPQGESA